MDQTPVGQPAAPEYEARLSAMENAVSDIACDLRVLSERVDSGFREMHELRGGHNEKFAEAKEAISELRRDHEAKFAEVKEAISELRRDHEAKFADVRAAISELRRDHEAKFVEVRRRFWNRSNSSTQKSTNQMLHTRSGWT
jgi:chromosome segregation ATPase